MQHHALGQRVCVLCVSVHTPACMRVVYMRVWRISTRAQCSQAEYATAAVPSRARINVCDDDADDDDDVESWEHSGASRDVRASTCVLIRSIRTCVYDDTVHLLRAWSTYTNALTAMCAGTANQVAEIHINTQFRKLENIISVLSVCVYFRVHVCDDRVYRRIGGLVCVYVRRST